MEDKFSFFFFSRANLQCIQRISNMSSFWTRTSGEMNPDVSIHKVTGRHSEVTYRPTLRDQAVFSSTGVKAQFIVRYDVARELAAADFQVRLAGGKC